MWMWMAHIFLLVHSDDDGESQLEFLGTLFLSAARNL